MRLFQSMLGLTACFFLWPAEAVAESGPAQITQVVAGGEHHATDLALVALAAPMPREMHRRTADERYLVTVRRLGRGSVHHRAGYPRAARYYRYHRSSDTSPYYRPSAHRHFYGPRHDRRHYSRSLYYPYGGHRYVLPYFAQPSYVQPAPYYSLAPRVRQQYRSSTVYGVYYGYPRVRGSGYASPPVIYRAPNREPRSGYGYRQPHRLGHTSRQPYGDARPQIHRIPGSYSNGHYQYGYPAQRQGHTHHGWR